MFQYQGLNANNANQCNNDDMPLTTVPNKQMMKILRPEIKPLYDLAEWCALPKGELHNHIDWCFKRFGNITDYVDHNQYFSCLNNTKFIGYNTVEISVMSMQCDEQAVHMVRCTRSTILYGGVCSSSQLSTSMWEGVSIVSFNETCRIDIRSIDVSGSSLQNRQVTS